MFSHKLSETVRDERVAVDYPIYGANDLDREDYSGQVAIQRDQYVEQQLAKFQEPVEHF